ncbi:fluoride efflux transporter FluC [Mycetocola miduiensis]|uniref:Fluoride-specific ion channel FluC n=1 Tax=Mycetocola miduiensis TaxID=995034 RepID=A0A1I4YXL5_9MICO|nr:CrcB family protein [Mycetocola miduiensis]SFN42751.1 camphor resistance protein CrcB [Mycetocola miduiensis]
MTPVLFLAVALAGGVGAAARFMLDGVMQSRATSYPLGTLVINISGSFLLGLATGLALSAALPPEAVTIVGSGFLGGYTTFSTASVESVRLIAARRYGAAFVGSVGMLVLSVAASAGGLVLGTLA